MPSVSCRCSPARLKTDACVLHAVCLRFLISTESASCAKSPAEPLASVFTVEASTPMRMLLNVASPCRSVMPICMFVAVAGVPPPPAVIFRPTGIPGTTTDWHRSYSFAVAMLAMEAGCVVPSFAVTVPAYCEKPVPSSCDAATWNVEPETVNATGTAPLATPVIRRLAAMPTGMAARATRPARFAARERSFIDPPRSVPRRDADPY